MNCPQCNGASREVYMVFNSFQYCDTCKEDVVVLEAKVRAANTTLEAVNELDLVVSSEYVKRYHEIQDNWRRLWQS